MSTGTSASAWEPALSLGPLLGVEGLGQYTVCALMPKPPKDSPIEVAKLALQIVNPARGEVTESVLPAKTVDLVSHIFVRFEFTVDVGDVERDVHYALLYDGVVIGNNPTKQSLWTFTVPSNQGMPRIAFASCNGFGHDHPSDIFAAVEESANWKSKLKWNAFRTQKKPYRLWEDLASWGDKPHYMLLAGDQIYADSIWKRVSTLAGYDPSEWPLASTPTTSDFNKGSCIDTFYEELYIHSWGETSIARVLATTPSVMMWDDHDIFDGWGSYTNGLQDTDAHKAVYASAEKYFQLLQIRSLDNRALLDKAVCHSMRVSLGAVEVVVLDNRRHRTPSQVMSQEQLDSLGLEKLEQYDAESEAPKELFADAGTSDRVLIFVVPVPMAHRDIRLGAEGVLDKSGNWGEQFRSGVLRPVGSVLRKLSGVADDSLDHWDHIAHMCQRDLLLKRFFHIGSEREAARVVIVSGDVHVGGAATVTVGERAITQVISSPIAHKPPSWIQTLAIRMFSKSETVSKELGVHLKHFGDSEKRDIRRRNFGLLFKNEDQALKANLYSEAWWGIKRSSRTINEFGLTEAQIDKVRRLSKDGSTIKDLALLFNVQDDTISAYLKRIEPKSKPG